MLSRIAPSLYAAVCTFLVDNPGVKTAVKFIDAKTIVRATWRHKPRSGDHKREMVVTFGRPNYRELAFIKRCKKSGESFPVREIQFRLYPKKKVK